MIVQIEYWRSIKTDKMIIVKKYWPFIVILIAGLFFKTYKPLQLFMYSHDQDLAGWIIKDVIVNHHLRLIGQETSSPGVFVGPLFYYMQIPFYLLANMDPAGSIVLVTLLGLFTIFSFYYCFAKMFGKKVGIFAALFYTVSVYFIFTDREIVPTTPVHLWTVWWLYGTWLILKGKSKAYVLLGFLAGILWNFNLALVIITPLVLLAQLFSKSKINLKYLFFGVVIFLVTMTPFIAFESRHSFMQTKAIVSSLTASKNSASVVGGKTLKLDRVIQLVYKNLSSIYWGPNSPINHIWTFCAILGAFIFLTIKKVISKQFFLILFLWQVLYIAFFTFNSIIVSEYYLNGMNVVWVAILALMTTYLWENRHGYLRWFAYLLLAVFAGVNIYAFFTWAVNKSGYIERKAIVAYIKTDAQEHSFPCISVSYITSPGNNLGYRYLFWLQNMHVDLPMGGAPVYSIVYPISLVDKVDKTFGALALIMPDYGKYTKEEIAKSCSGENQNVTGSMFGYTQ